IDQGSVDSLQLSTGQKPIEPTQLCLISLVRRLMALLVEPTNRCVLPDASRSVAKPLEPPDFALQLIVQLLRLGFVAGFSRSSYSPAIGRNEVNPPDRSAFA